MPSFDIVSEIDAHELENALDQTRREIGNRFDFKGANPEIDYQPPLIKLAAQSAFHVEQIHPVLFQRIAKRGIDLQSLDSGEVIERGQRAFQEITAREGIDRDTAGRIVKHIKGSKLKVQAAVQGEQLRVTGKKRDDLQQAITALKEEDFGLPLQYKNFRD
ncbi:YajQ family cyclic di-GMP-binding protein [Gammaproteobacteria bacterium]|nr:YajQ family cyclic di-GMP-binding protein [Gammaproteobacteria bacterium]